MRYTISFLWGTANNKKKKEMMMEKKNTGLVCLQRVCYGVYKYTNKLKAITQRSSLLTDDFNSFRKLVTNPSKRHF